MTTEKQIEANRGNAQLSTGAVSQEGKVIVSYNAIKHGIFAKDLVIKSEVGQENEVEYLELLGGLIESLVPQGKMENLLVEKIAIDFWRLRRVMRFEAGSLRQHLNEVLENHYSSWGGWQRNFSAADIDKKIDEANSYIDWNRKYLACLQKGVVKFDQPLWEGKEIESNIEDDLYIIAQLIDRKLLSEGERKKLEYGELDFPALKEIIARADYITEQQIADELIEHFMEQNEKYEREIESLKEQKIANGIADDLNGKLCSLPPSDSLEKILKYETSIQKSIFQNIIMLKKLQGASL